MFERGVIRSTPWICVNKHTLLDSDGRAAVISIVGDIYKDTVMIRNYFKIACRNLLRNKVFSLINILGLASLGLFSLSRFMISHRTKEIAVRKVLGATISSMVALFYRDFFRLIMISNLIALPATYFLAERWLSEYAFRTEIGWFIFLTPAIVLLTISLATVGIQTIKTGLMNPVKSLRSE